MHCQEIIQAVLKSINWFCLKNHKHPPQAMNKLNVSNLNMKLTFSPVRFPRVLSGSIATLLAGACLGVCFSITSYGLPVGGQVAAGQAQSERIEPVRLGPRGRAVPGSVERAAIRARSRARAVNQSIRNILKPAKKSNSTNVSQNSNRHNKFINFNINFNLEFSKIKDRTNVQNSREFIDQNPC